MKRSEIARENFQSGMNCAQSVAMAFYDVTEFSREQMLKLSAPFGGGVGRLREICGALSGMLMIVGILFYDSNNVTLEEKSILYAREQELAYRFKKANGSLICRELLENAEVTADSKPQAEERTEEYYKKRPCVEICMAAADILQDYLVENGKMSADGEKI